MQLRALAIGAAALALAGGAAPAPEQAHTAPTAHEQIEAMAVSPDPMFTSWVENQGDAARRATIRELLPMAPRADHWRLYQTLGAIDETLFEWSKAVADYRAASGAANSPTELAAAQLGIARAQRIISPAEAEATLAGLAGVVAAAPAVAHLRARLALAVGNSQQALTRLGEALGTAGKYRNEATPALLQAIIADMSIAAALAGDLSGAADYAAATGIGDTGNEAALASFTPARCDLAAGLRPDDAAIFDVTAYSGRSRRVVAVWSRHLGGEAAVAQLGRAVANIRWQRDAAPNVLARGIRVFVACSPGGFETAGGVTASERSWIPWLITRGVPIRPYRDVLPEVSMREDVDALAAAEARDGVESINLLPLLVGLGNNPEMPPAAARGHFERAAAILVANAGPPWAIAQLQRFIIETFAENQAAGEAELAGSLPKVLAKIPSAEQTAGFSLLIRLRLARALEATGDIAGAEAGYRALLTLPAATLPATDPFRRVVAYQLALLLDRRGRRAEADDVRRNPGLALSLCRYADTRVTATGVTIAEDDYPAFLRRTGIGGLVKIEREVAADGATSAARVVYAQPPFLFDKTSLAPFSGSRNVVPTRGGKPFACTTEPQTIRWKLATAAR